ncbi:uncharacterized protein [Ptychodera flava]|uniref:uncharacterized protein isoform X2 n=1 Tax=Ptychodera flava TaxID=63121 RepID=UPI00396A702C
MKSFENFPYIPTGVIGILQTISGAFIGSCGIAGIVLYCRGNFPVLDLVFGWIILLTGSLGCLSTTRNSRGYVKASLVLSIICTVLCCPILLIMKWIFFYHYHERRCRTINILVITAAFVSFFLAFINSVLCCSIWNPGSRTEDTELLIQPDMQDQQSSAQISGSNTRKSPPFLYRTTMVICVCQVVLGLAATLAGSLAVRHSCSRTWANVGFGIYSGVPIAAAGLVSLISAKKRSKGRLTHCIVLEIILISTGTISMVLAILLAAMHCTFCSALYATKPMVMVVSGDEDIMNLLQGGSRGGQVNKIETISSSLEVRNDHIVVAETAFS